MTQGGGSLLRLCECTACRAPQIHPCALRTEAACCVSICRHPAWNDAGRGQPAARNEFHGIPQGTTKCFRVSLVALCILNSQFSILNSQFSILNFQFSILNSQFSILNSQFSIFNSQFSILNSQFSIFNFQFSISSLLRLRCAA
jgi:hypothetical protein